MDLSATRSWSGEFFPPSAFDRRFFGQVEYSPEAGILLTYTIVGNELPAETPVLHGVLSTGERCTLIGRFQPYRAGICIRYEQVTRPGRAGFLSFVIGDFLEPEARLPLFTFTLTNLQEFFFRANREALAGPAEEPLLEVTAPFGGIEVHQTGSFDFVHRQIDAHISSNDKAAATELQAAYEQVRDKYRDAVFLLKRRITYRIRLRFSDGATISEGYERIAELANLFAILTYCPVLPESIHAVAACGEEGERAPTLRVYPALAMNPRTLDLTKESRRHWDMPISNATVPLDTIMGRWLERSSRHSTVVAGIQNETGFRDEHSAQGELVLYATMLESIAYTEGAKEKRYEHAVSRHASVNVQEGLRKSLGKAGFDDIGRGISDVRNEIAHVQRPRKALSALSIRDIARLSQYCQMTILGYVLRDIGVPEEIVMRYQAAFSPPVGE